MIITEETDTKLVVKKTPSHLWLYTLGASILFLFIALAISSAARMNKVEPRGSSRSTAGGVIFILPFATLLYYFLDRRQNRKALIMDSAERTLSVVGARTDKVSFDEINGFSLDKTAITNSKLIVLEMKNGLRFGTGIDGHRGRAEDVEMIMQKLSARLNRSPARTN